MRLFSRSPSAFAASAFAADTASGRADLLLGVFGRQRDTGLCAEILEIDARVGDIDAALDLAHLLGIKSLYVTEISAPMETSTKQVYELTLQATEFLPVKKKKNVTLTPTMSATTADVPVEPGLIPPSESDTGP